MKIANKSVTNTATTNNADTIITVVNNPDTYPKTSNAAHAQHNDSFVCYRCGACCRDLPNTDDIRTLGIRRSDGSCINFDAETNTCRIYDERPTACNIVGTYMEHFRGQMRWGGYAEKMMRACYLLRQMQDIEEPENSPYRNEAVGNAQKRASGEEAPDPEKEMLELTKDVYGEEWLEKQVESETTYAIAHEDHADVEKFGYVLASKMLVDEQRKVGYMYREEPDNENDSGWRFYCGDEDDEYLNDPDNIGVYDIQTIVEMDESILPFISEEVGSAFVFEDGNWQRTEMPEGDDDSDRTSDISKGGEDKSLTSDEEEQTEKPRSKWL